MKKKIKVLFVCMGNICRSPMAEGVFRHMVEQEGLAHIIKTDSAGTHAYHIGERPDKRAQETSKSHGVDISDLKARKAVIKDFHQFDYILAMDSDNYELLSDLSPEGMESCLSLFLDFAAELDKADVPDPYYGGIKGFEYVYDLVEAASTGLLEDIKNNHLD